MSETTHTTLMSESATGDRTSEQGALMHTPGPWFFDGELIVTLSDGAKVADPHCRPTHETEPGEAEGNGFLIAAAPAMLVALQAMTRVAEGQGSKWREKLPDGSSPLGLARAAISKATGAA